MRKWNAVISIAVIALFLLHAVTGALQLMGLLSGGSALLNILTWSMAVLLILHSVIGTILTAQTLKIQRKSGAAYFRENKLFWTRRISGFAVVVFLMLHILIFLGKSGAVFRLHYYGQMQMISQIFLVISLGVHLLTNIRPLMISLGAKGYRVLLGDILLILSILLVFSGIGFVIYYLRWQQL